MFCFLWFFTFIYRKRICTCLKKNMIGSSRKKAYPSSAHEYILLSLSDWNLLMQQVKCLNCSRTCITSRVYVFVLLNGWFMVSYNNPFICCSSFNPYNFTHSNDCFSVNFMSKMMRCCKWFQCHVMSFYANLSFLCEHWFILTKNVSNQTSSVELYLLWCIMKRPMTNDWGSLNKNRL